MKNLGVSRILCILLVLVTVFSVSSYIFFKQDIARYSKGAVLSSTEVEKSLEEFETLIEIETDDYTYYNNLAAGFVPSLNYHIITSNRFINKYDDFYWETYEPLSDSIRHSANNFTKVNDKESYESARKEFKQELEKYSEAVKTLKDLDWN
jgi:hypothetical protein